MLIYIYIYTCLSLSLSLYIYICIHIYIYIYIKDACGGTSPHPAGSLPVEFAEIAAFAFCVNLAFDMFADIAFSKVPRLGFLS